MDAAELFCKHRGYQTHEPHFDLRRIRPSTENGKGTNGLTLKTTNPTFASQRLQSGIPANLNKPMKKTTRPRTRT
jgi:hypothetical protein